MYYFIYNTSTKQLNSLFLLNLFLNQTVFKMTFW